MSEGGREGGREGGGREGVGEGEGGSSPSTELPCRLVADVNARPANPGVKIKATPANVHCRHDNFLAGASIQPAGARTPAKASVQHYPMQIKGDLSYPIVTRAPAAVAAATGTAAAAAAAAAAGAAAADGAAPAPPPPPAAAAASAAAGAAFLHGFAGILKWNTQAAISCKLRNPSSVHLSPPLRSSSVSLRRRSICARALSCAEVVA